MAAICRNHRTVLIGFDVQNSIGILYIHRTLSYISCIVFQVYCHAFTCLLLISSNISFCKFYNTVNKCHSSLHLHVTLTEVVTGYYILGLICYVRMLHGAALKAKSVWFAFFRSLSQTDERANLKTKFLYLSI